MKNYERPSLPRTGSSIMIFILFVGFSLLIIGSYGYLHSINKYSRDNNKTLFKD